MSRLLRTTGAVLAVSASLIAVGCSDDNAEEQATAADSAATSATADSEDGAVTLSVSPADDLTDGEELTLKLSGLDPEMGYYVAVCTDKTEGDANVPVCLGAHGEENKQLWLTNQSDSATESIPDDGAVVLKLSATQSGQDMNGDEITCGEENCSVKVFGDHRNGFIDVVEVPIEFDD
ncbi:hypothetical protein KRX51_07845 [Corynebacterium sp. TAE3-ERU12]|uniref:hypothetical protein n=1 Tax=Corynebacterium sp. TAE3-ERU12 TaxID=2849491 RepID=UPI001C438E46|nr:hypothetical protein [Corynebacterium sp. TAE3-ERU12]MBV7295823.1 hypothetical protein [Corynebacterium sp. TAE3-ERU12]